MYRSCRFCATKIAPGEETYFHQIIPFSDDLIGKSGFIVINDAVSDVVPEINLDLIPNPCICNHCISNLKKAVHFRNLCFKAEKNLLKLNGQNDTLFLHEYKYRINHFSKELTLKQDGIRKVYSKDKIKMKRGIDFKELFELKSSVEGRNAAVVKEDANIIQKYKKYFYQCKICGKTPLASTCAAKKHIQYHLSKNNAYYLCPSCENYIPEDNLDDHTFKCNLFEQVPSSGNEQNEIIDVDSINEPGNSLSRESLIVKNKYDNLKTYEIKNRLSDKEKNITVRQLLKVKKLEDLMDKNIKKKEDLSSSKKPTEEKLPVPEKKIKLSSDSYTEESKNDSKIQNSDTVMPQNKNYKVIKLKVKKSETNLEKTLNSSSIENDAGNPEKLKTYCSYNSKRKKIIVDLSKKDQSTSVIKVDDNELKNSNRNEPANINSCEINTNSSFLKNSSNFDQEKNDCVETFCVDIKEEIFENEDCCIDDKSLVPILNDEIDINPGNCIEKDTEIMENSENNSKIKKKSATLCSPKEGGNEKKFKTKNDHLNEDIYQISLPLPFKSYASNKIKKKTVTEINKIPETNFSTSSGVVNLDCKKTNTELTTLDLDFEQVDFSSNMFGENVRSSFSKQPEDDRDNLEKTMLKCGICDAPIVFDCHKSAMIHVRKHLFPPKTNDQFYPFCDKKMGSVKHLLQCGGLQYIRVRATSTPLSFNSN